VDPDQVADIEVAGGGGNADERLRLEMLGRVE
jgi:hypothetical protein